MPNKANPVLNVSPEQMLYAKLLEKGMYLGLALLLVTFLLYASSIMKPYIPLSDVSKYWSHSVYDYLHMANVKAGWSWINMLHYGDFVNFIPIAILGGITIFCYLSIIPTLLRNGDKVYAILALIEAVILTVAASGILGSGGH
jgi:hypothetical protein